MRCGAVLGILTITTMLATVASAQEQVAGSFEDLRDSSRLKPGDAVLVTHEDGARTKGTVESLSSTLLRLKAGRDGLELSEDAVTKVDRRDPVSNGIWIGATVGVGAMLVTTRTMCGDDPECGAIVNVYVGLPTIGIGALAGALIDRSRTETVFQASRRSALTRLTLSPLVSRKENGFLVSFKW